MRLLQMALLVALATGCDSTLDTPPSVPFTGVSDTILRTQVQAALQQANEQDRRVLLVFVADWCEDCHEVVRLAGQGASAEVLQNGYEVVYIDIGRRDRHTVWTNHYRVDRIATLVVLDGEGNRVAQTTLEPISTRSGLTDQELSNWLRAPRDAWSRGTSPPSDVPLFPPDILSEG